MALELCQIWSQVFLIFVVVVDIIVVGVTVAVDNIVDFVMVVDVVDIVVAIAVVEWE